MSTPKPVVLCILDGWGDRDTPENNAPALAKTPNFDRIRAADPSSQLVTFGPEVGLPKGQMGNSEVGHTNIGAGRIVAMDLGQIDLAIEDGSFFENGALQSFISNLNASGGTAHLMGVVSDGGVHGHLNHIVAAAKALRDADVPVVIHAITDGRDVAPQSALGFLDDLLAKLPDGCTIGTLTGRYYAMDRDNRWERVETAYRAMVDGTGAATADTARFAVKQSYDADKTDEFIPATVIGDYAGMQDQDGIFCLNFRADRAREILRTMGQPDFAEFDVSDRPDFNAKLGMVEYSDAHADWFSAVFPKRVLKNTLGEWVAAQGLRQFRVAETEKYPHVTFFLNGGKETAEQGEDREMPKSPKVATYDMQPEMSESAVTDCLVQAIHDGYDLIVCNYANPDMVGHTGDLTAAIAACEAVDKGLGRALDALEKANGAMIVTADHGNCETMVDPDTGGPHTSHTTNLVPCILVGGPAGAGLSDGKLGDLAPTLLELMGLDQPKEMTGESLLRR